MDYNLTKIPLNPINLPFSRPEALRHALDGFVIVATRLGPRAWFLGQDGVSRKNIGSTMKISTRNIEL